MSTADAPHVGLSTAWREAAFCAADDATDCAVGTAAVNAAADAAVRVVLRHLHERLADMEAEYAMRGYSPPFERAQDIIARHLTDL